MRAACVAMLLVAAAARTAAGDVAVAPTDGAWGAPRVVLTSHAHERGVTELLFALYDGGRVVYPAPDRHLHDSYLTVALTADEERALLDGLALDRVGVLQPHPVGGDDGATRCIVVFANGAARRSCGWMAFGDDDEPALVAIWKRLLRFSSARATAWTPVRVSVLFRRYDAASCGPPLEGHQWPTSWPAPPPLPPAGPPLSRGDLDLPGTALPTLHALQEGRTARQCAPPVRAGDRWLQVRWTIHFPHEERWARPR